MSTDELKKMSVDEQAKQCARHPWGRGVLSAIFGIYLFGGMKLAEGFGVAICFVFAIVFLGLGIWLIFVKQDSNQLAIIEAAKQTLADREIKKKDDERKQDLIKQSIENYVKEVGPYNKAIIISDVIDIKSYILIFAAVKKMLLNGTIISFNDVISLEVQDYPVVKKGEITAVSSTDGGEVVGRAILGGLLLGSTGAIIGGTTASTNTQFKQGDDEVIHDYHAIVNMNSFESPVIDVPIGNDPSIANEVKAIFNLIQINK